MIRVELRTVQRFSWGRVGVICTAVMVTVFTVVLIDRGIEGNLEKLSTYSINPNPQMSQGLQSSEADALSPSTLLIPMSTLDGVRLFQFCDYVPNVARIFSLSTNAEGEYLIEGFCPVDAEPGLLTALRMFKSFPAGANLSYWRQGRDPVSHYRFAFRGCLPRFPGKELSAVASTEAESLLARIVSHATASGLRAVHADEVNTLRLSDKLERWRAKYWAIGSRSHISIFVKSVVDREPYGALSELLVIPSQVEDAFSWENAQVFATVDAVVTISRGGHGDVL